MALSKDQVAELVRRKATIEEIEALDAGDPTSVAPPPAALYRDMGGGGRRPNARGLARALPDVLAGAGGLIPGPIGVGASSVLGMIGKAAELGITGEDPGPTTRIGYPYSAIIPHKVMQEGLKQTALGTGGGVAAKAVRGVGRGLYQGALRPTKELLSRFPNVVDDLMKLRTPLGKGGVEKAEKALGEAVARQDIVLDTAEAAGAKVPLQPGIDAARQAIAKVQRGGLSVNKRVAMLEKELGTIIDENAPMMTPNEANHFIQALQEEVAPLFVANKTGVPIAGSQSILMRMQHRMEWAMRKALRESVPGIAEAKAKTQSAKAAVAGAKHAALGSAKGTPAKLPVIPTAVRAFTPDEVRTIELISRLGLGVADPITAGIARQIPRGAAAVFTGGEMPPDTLTRRE